METVTCIHRPRPPSILLPFYYSVTCYCHSSMPDCHTCMYSGQPALQMHSKNRKCCRLHMNAETTVQSLRSVRCPPHNLLWKTCLDLTCLLQIDHDCTRFCATYRSWQLVYSIFYAIATIQCKVYLMQSAQDILCYSIRSYRQCTVYAIAYRATIQCTVHLMLYIHVVYSAHDILCYSIQSYHTVHSIATSPMSPQLSHCEAGSSSSASSEVHSGAPPGCVAWVSTSYGDRYDRICCLRQH